jgi:ketosteroid isomerase-like protein
MGDETEAELLRLEHARCEAISRGDVEAVERMIAPELSHTHATGAMQGKREYLADLRERTRTTTRAEDLRVRLYGDVAVMTGTLHNTFAPETPGAEPRVVSLQALQVWVRGAEGWRQVAYASSGR